MTSVPKHEGHVELVLSQFLLFGGTVDQDHVVSVSRKAASEVAPDFSCAHHDITSLFHSPGFLRFI